MTRSHAALHEVGPAEEVARSDDERNLHTHSLKFGHSACNRVERIRVDSEALLSHQRLAAQLEQHTPAGDSFCDFSRYVIAALHQPPRACAITSSAKFSLFLSIPSPTSNRSKRSTVPADDRRYSPTDRSGSLTNG